MFSQIILKANSRCNEGICLPSVYGKLHPEKAVWYKWGIVLNMRLPPLQERPLWSAWTKSLQLTCRTCVTTQQRTIVQAHLSVYDRGTSWQPCKKYCMYHKKLKVNRFFFWWQLTDKTHQWLWRLFFTHLVQSSIAPLHLSISLSM